MKDLSENNSGLKHRLENAFRFLSAEGLFILGLGLGWSLALMNEDMAVGKLPLFLMGLGLSLFLLALAIFAFKHRRFGQSPHYAGSSVDLESSWKALKIHGNQPPLVKNSLIQSELFRISRRESLLFSRGRGLLIENREGPDLKVSLQKRDVEVISGGFVYLDSDMGESWQDQKVRIPIEPADESADEDIMVLIHIISKEA